MNVMDSTRRAETCSAFRDACAVFRDVRGARPADRRVARDAKENPAEAGFQTNGSFE
jgi:hypothetical protein